MVDKVFVAISFLALALVISSSALIFKTVLHSLPGFGVPPGVPLQSFPKNKSSFPLPLCLLLWSEQFWDPWGKPTAASSPTISITERPKDKFLHLFNSQASPLWMSNATDKCKLSNPHQY